ncbi:putative metal-dependent hydrolase [Alicyclobacillus cycloheptanicus]|uniref:Damage-inducible protein DinB n=1 Tax=Alicyclobacillus cycloheptanicus TaxID=1457 RepID=A0ABT9XMB8_9BACL|nr:putative metal-dependent hydrolase [Alicyclobacillus cycloheptanicus]MDQ0191457.1 putative damage-inducible protein DinB [Alicyclobacillus cycloheptanicus]WDM00779.1 putative metal-dependent hydrolase [Alicyclobacillus cycloheptanicus]
MDEVRYPLGKFVPIQEVSDEQRKAWIKDIVDAPSKLNQAVESLLPEQLDTPYREGGWTVRQIVHHLAENDVLVYTRFKHALTEENPQILPAMENLWAELPDQSAPVSSSLRLFELIHERWAALLNGMSTEDFSRTFVHPASGVWSLDKALGVYSWHDRHHTAQIKAFRERMGW